MSNEDWNRGFNKGRSNTAQQCGSILHEVLENVTGLSDGHRAAFTAAIASMDALAGRATGDGTEALPGEAAFDAMLARSTGKPSAAVGDLGDQLVAFRAAQRAALQVRD